MSPGCAAMSVVGAGARVPCASTPEAGIVVSTSVRGETSVDVLAQAYEKPSCTLGERTSDATEYEPYNWFPDNSRAISSSDSWAVGMPNIVLQRGMLSDSFTITYECPETAAPHFCADFTRHGARMLHTSYTIDDSEQGQLLGRACLRWRIASRIPYTNSATARADMAPTAANPSVQALPGGCDRDAFSAAPAMAQSRSSPPHVPARRARPLGSVVRLWAASPPNARESR